MHQHQHQHEHERHGPAPLRPRSLSGRSRLLPAALAVTGEASVEHKLDGARIQVHRDGSEVRVYTRSLADVTARVPEIVEVARALPVASVILDGEMFEARIGQPIRLTPAKPLSFVRLAA